ncbi:MAG TPA: DNA polymerase III subunit gamma/tau [Pyrinomonadaceae bacterium]|nr:DNA polymerase III subunit gamma/tau [Acidobacteriota bacterium]HQZ96777.1 DNA polymerase III subunit gamma/tau [Pyrinomonadaceae bacterium]
MSYQVIARKWRPQTFEEVTGQEIITQTLRNALEFDRLHHAYLFSGARGVGKTTTARILAKALNCHKTQGKPNLTPCLLTDPTICPSCLEISESRSMDVLEIDAASHTGIDDVRGTIIDSINFNPARDRYKVFIIDEVHQLSKSAFNALLKTLEEPPGNVVFVMATTELHKVPETILSRCQEFEFRTIPLTKIFDRLKLIAEAEKIDISDDALRELARSGEGSMRDAQSNFDQVISFSSDTISSADVTNALGFAGVEVLSKAINAIAERQPKAALDVVDNLISRGHDLRNFCRDVLGLFRDLLVFKVSGGDTNLYEGAVFSPEELAKLAEPFSESDLLRFFNSLAETEASLREAVHPRYVLEVGLVKLIEMRKVATIESILERLDALTNGSPMPVSSIAAAAVPEKKTLIIDPPPAAAKAIEPIEAPKPVEKAPLRVETPAPPRFDPPEPPEEFHGFDEPVFEESPFSPGEDFEPVPLPRAPIRENFSQLQVRLMPLSADELEHFDDKRLDESYEEKLTFDDDDLMPIKNASNIVKVLFGDVYERPAARSYTPNGHTAAAVVPAFDVLKLKEELGHTEDVHVELPVLGAEPTDEELLAYAKAHPSVRAAMRVFKAKILEVRKA